MSAYSSEANKLCIDTVGQ